VPPALLRSATARDLCPHRGHGSALARRRQPVFVRPRVPHHRWEPVTKAVLPSSFITISDLLVFIGHRLAPAPGTFPYDAGIAFQWDQRATDIRPVLQLRDMRVVVMGGAQCGSETAHAVCSPSAVVVSARNTAACRTACKTLESCRYRDLRSGQSWRLPCTIRNRLRQQRHTWHRQPHERDGSPASGHARPRTPDSRSRCERRHTGIVP